MSDSIKYPLNISVKMYLNTGLERSKTVTLMTYRVSMSIEDGNACGQSMLTEVMIHNDNLNQDCIFYEIRMILRGYKHKYL